jgi:hypothetical protein
MGGEAAEGGIEAPARILDLLDLDKETHDDTFGYSLLDDTLSDVAHRTERIATAAGDLDLPTEIFGLESLQRKLRALVLEFKAVFSRSVGSDPARVSPMHIEIEYSKWEGRTRA